MSTGVTTRRRILLTIASVPVTFSIGWVLAARYLPPSVKYRSEIARVNQLVDSIEQFKAANGRYPSEGELGAENGRTFYQCSGEGYVIGFSSGFDGFFSYSSTTRKWSFEN